MRQQADSITIPARILIVDDDTSFRQEFIECFDEYAFAEAASGEEALRILRKPNEIDLVILDVRMSGIGGIETLDKIKKEFPSLRVIIFTAYGSKDTAVEALRGRADDYLEKPLDIEAARQTIEKHLAQRQIEEHGSDLAGKMERVKEYLQRNYHKKVTLNDAALAVSLSPKYLSRVFKDHARMGFNEYKLALRIEQAKKMLAHTSDTIEHISDALGYENPESFVRQFKKLVAVTPGVFREKSRRT